MELDPSYPDVREDYCRATPGRPLEDSARAARQLVTLDPYFGVGWNRVYSAGVVLDRRADVEEAVRWTARHLSRRIFFSKLGLLDYAVAYRRADEARTELAKIPGGRWPRDAAFAQNLVAVGAGRAGHRSRQTARGDRGRTTGATQPASFIARQDIDGYNVILEEAL